MAQIAPVNVRSVSILLNNKIALILKTQESDPKKVNKNLDKLSFDKLDTLLFQMEMAKIENPHVNKLMKQVIKKAKKSLAKKPKPKPKPKKNGVKKKIIKKIKKVFRKK